MEAPSRMSPESSHKRPRSPSGDASLPPTKVRRTIPGQVQINYLARQSQETIPLVTNNEKLPEIARLIGEYDSVLQRHESMAGNLGACPLGPILLKRFERLFDGPPRILKSHGKEASVSWLDVVEFAQSKPEQFNLERMRNGVRVCQFYTKQSRVEISEEDFVLIRSGMPQKLIPPQPIPEDEEKEMAVLDLLDKNLTQVIQLADQVSARARQLTHKMKNRRAAIVSRREQQTEDRRATVRSDDSPLPGADANGAPSRVVRSVEQSQSPPAGFTAVNLRQPTATHENERRSKAKADTTTMPEDLFASTSAQNVTIINGKSIKGASPAVRDELMKKFLSNNEPEPEPETTTRRTSQGTSRTNAMNASAESRLRSGSFDVPGMNVLNRNPSTVAIPNTPASLLPLVKPAMLDRDDGGPFKAEMVSRMEVMLKGERVLPPCDRCRRLHMDCLKNLTACWGCTKKHAKCSWRDVREEELREHPAPDRKGFDGTRDEEGPESTIEVATTVPKARERRLSNASDVTSRTKDPPDDQDGARDRERAIDETVGGTARARTVSHASARQNTATIGTAASSDPPISSSSTSRFNVQPPPIAQQLHEPANAGSIGGGPGSARSPQGQYSHFPHHSPSLSRDSTEKNPGTDRDLDDGDRLQALAAQVYRSASQSVRPPE